MIDSRAGTPAHTFSSRPHPRWLRIVLAVALLAAAAGRLRATTTNVPAGADLQAAIDAAQPGDTLLLAAGATFTGPITLRYKTGTGTDADWITIRTGTPDSSLPPGQRVFPADAAKLAKIVAPGSGVQALLTEPQAHHYQLIGLEIAPEDAQTAVEDLVVLGSNDAAQTTLAQVPSHLVIDRCYIHALPGQALKRGVQLNSASTSIVNSYLSDFKVGDVDAQAIGGFNGPGPFTIANYLEAAGENLLFGGADSAIPNLVPSDITIRGNYFNKPLTWHLGDPSYAGTHWQVKNLLELKNAQRVTIDGNVLEHCWTDGQDGHAILFTPRNQDGHAPWSTVQDVTFTHNVVRHSASAIQLLGTDYDHPSQQEQRITVANNVFDDIDGTKWIGDGRFLTIVAGIVDLTVDHNTTFQNSNITEADGAPSTRFVFTNNVTPHNSYGVHGSDHASGTDTLNAFFPGFTFRRNVIPGAPASDYPTDNFYPATLDDVGFVDRAGGDYHLAAGSPYKGQGTDGNDPGADVDAVAAATAHAIDGAPTSGPGGGSPYGGSPAPVPGTIKASDFDNGGEGVAYHDTTPGNDSSSTYRTSDVDLYEDNVVDLATGEWLQYTVNVAATSSTYAIVAQVSAISTAGTFHVEVDGVDVTGPLAVPVTGDWSTWGSAIKQGVTLSAGVHVLRVAVDSGFDGFYSLRIVDTSVAATPFGGTARTLPGTVQAVDYDDGGELVGYHDNTTGCSGSCGYRTADDVDRWDQIVFGTGTGEWLQYTVDVTASGTYTLSVQAGSGGGGGTFHVEVDGVDVTGPMDIPDTGGWNTFQTLTRTVTLSAGQRVVRLVVDDSRGAVDAGSFNTWTVGP